MGRLTGKVAIVTGAGGGQGAAEASLFVAEGATVVLTDIDDARGRAVADGLGAAARFMHHDVSSRDDWQIVVEETLSTFGRLDILINNAGVYKPKGFDETDQALMDLHYRVNVLGVFHGMKAVRQALTDVGGGRIVNVASGAGLRGYPGMFAYAASKWAVRGLSKCAAVELAASGIRVNAILPGLIDTPMLGENSEEYMQSLIRFIPIGRLGGSEEIAEAALFLASDASSYVTGAELVVCGGMMA